MPAANNPPGPPFAAILRQRATFIAGSPFARKETLLNAFGTHGRQSFNGKHRSRVIQFFWKSPLPQTWGRVARRAVYETAGGRRPGWGPAIKRRVPSEELNDP